MFIQIDIGIGIEIEFNVRWFSLKVSLFFPCTFLGGKKSTKRTAPCGLAFGCPRTGRFFGAGRNSLRSDSLPAFFRKTRLRSAAPQRAMGPAMMPGRDMPADNQT